MNRPLASRIFWIFLLGWLGAQGILFCGTLAFPYTAGRFETEMYKGVANALSEEIALERSLGRTSEASLRSLFGFLQKIAPELEAYLLDSQGKIIFARSPALVGTTLPNPSVSVTRVPSDAPDVVLGEQAIISVEAEHGPKAFFSSAEGLRHIAFLFLPGVLSSFLIVLLFANLLSRSLTKDLHFLRSLIRQYASGISTARAECNSGKELNRIGASLNELVNTFEQRRGELSGSIARRKAFLAALVHDLLRPLQAIKLISEREQGKTSPSISENVLRELTDSLQSELTLLEVLPESVPVGVDAGEPPPHPQDQPTPSRASLSEVLTALSQDLAPLFENLGLSVRLEIQNPLPTALAQRNDLYRIFLNLADNAARYSPKGSSVEIRARAMEGLLIGEIVDQGIGIRQEDRERIFDPAFRGEDARTQSPSGSGLGLSIVKSLVTTLRGEIEVRSVLGKGSVFRVTLPSVENAFVPHRGEREEPAATSAPSQKGSLCSTKDRDLLQLGASGVLFALLCALFLLGSKGQHRVHLPSLTLSVILGMGLAQLAPLQRLSQGLSRGDFQAFCRALLRASLLYGVGRLVSGLSPLSPQHAIRAEDLYFAQAAGFLSGIALFFRPLLTTGLPIFLTLTLPVGATILQIAKASMTAAFLVSLFAALVFQVQTHYRGHLPLAFRTGCVILLILFNSVVYQIIFVGVEFQRVLLEKSPVLTSEGLSEIATSFNEIPSSLGEQSLRAELAKRSLLVSRLSPRLSVRVLQGEHTLIPPALVFTAADRLELPSALLHRLSLLASSGSSLETIEGLRYGLIPLKNFPAISLVVLEDGSASSYFLRKIGGGVLLVTGVTIFVALLLLSGLLSTLTFRRLSQHSRQIAKALDLFRMRGGIPPAPESPRDEIQTLQGELALFCTSLEKTFSELSQREAMTLALAVSTRQAVESRMSALQTLMSLGTAGDLERQGVLEQVHAENETLIRLLKEIVEFTQTSSEGTAGASAGESLRNAVEDFVLEIASEQRGRSEHTIRYELSESILDPSEKRSLLLVLKSILRDLSEISSVRLNAESRGSTCCFEFQLENARPSKQSASGILRRKLWNLVVEELGGSLEEDEQTLRLLVPQTPQ